MILLPRQLFVTQGARLSNSAPPQPWRPTGRRSSTEGARRLSSRSTLVLKRLLPLLWVVMPVAVVVALFALLRHPARRGVPTPLLWVPALVALLMALVGYLITKHLVLDLADEVWDEGDALNVRFGAEQQRIALADIINVGYTQFVNPPRITLTLRQAGRVGREVSFSPQRRFLSPFRRNPLIAELIERAHAARSR
jgi:hypothetical protein